MNKETLVRVTEGIRSSGLRSLPGFIIILVQEEVPLCLTLGAKQLTGQAVKGMGASLPALVRHRRCATATASLCIGTKGL